MGTIELAQPRTELLEAGLRQRLRGRLRDLRVLTRDEGLVLRGRAASYHVKQLAQHAVMELSDLPILANEIQVFRPDRDWPPVAGAIAAG
jgi:hypothetical protein